MPVTVCPNAIADLRGIRQGDAAAAAAILAVLQQLHADVDLIDKLTARGRLTSGDHVLSNQRWQAIRSRANLWRFRILESPATRYRVFHAYHWRSRRIRVLAIVHRSQLDYDDTESPFTRRMLRDWQRIEAGEL